MEIDQAGLNRIEQQSIQLKRALCSYILMIIYESFGCPSTDNAVELLLKEPNTKH